MNNRAMRLSLGLAAALTLAVLPAAAGTVSGVVHNGTTGKIGSGVEVILIQLQSGMQNVAQTKTDAQGHFQISNPSIGQQAMLLRAVYEGVYYYQPVPPGKSDASIDVNIYEPTQDRSAFQVLHHIVALEPQDGSLMVGEEFDIQNQTKPPKAFFRSGGSFEFELPQGADLNQAEAWGPSGMPVVQATVNQGKNRYTISFPFRPGQNGVRFSYKMNYPDNQTTLHLLSPYSAQTTMLLAPPAVKVIGEGFSPAGNEQGWSVYTSQTMKANSPVLLSVSGTGPPPSSTSDSGQGQSGDSQASSADTVTPVAQALPPRLDSVRWIVIAGFAALFLLGATFLWWKSRNPAAVAVAGVAPGAGPGPAKTAAQAVGGDGGGEQLLRQSVDEIKETLFRLELRRQAGTLSEEEYQAQRQNMEKALRDLVKG